MSKEDSFTPFLPCLHEEFQGMKAMLIARIILSDEQCPILMMRGQYFLAESISSYSWEGWSWLLVE